MKDRWYLASRSGLFIIDAFCDGLSAQPRAAPSVGGIRKGARVIRFRRFLNSDPPGIVEVWNESICERGAFPIHSTALFEQMIFAKPYFDPDGLLIAEEDGQVVGFVHAAFGPNAAETAVSTDIGIICILAVHPGHRHKGIGTTLLHRAEDYLRGRGAKQLIAGGMRPLNPFYFGLYGGADSPGFLASDAAAAPFFEQQGYVGSGNCLVFELNLEEYAPPVDSRFLSLRRKYDVQLVPQAELKSWWQDCVMGQIEPVEFRLTDKLSGIPEARVLAWEPSSLRQPSPPSAGLLDIQVQADLRRQGLARFLLSQLFRYIQEQYFTLVMMQVPELNHPVVALAKSLGFEQVDTGRSFRKEKNPTSE
jgi:GNAT superfamily N-acetyltransferase